jgi:phage-related minor tail protein
MSTTQVSIRLGVEGKAEVKRAFDEVGKAGQDAFRGVATSMDAAGAAADRETQRIQRLAQAARQAAAADQAQRSFNQVLGVGIGPSKSARNSAAVFEEAARAAEDLAARTAALRAQIDPLGAAQTRLNAEIAEANALFKAGAITAEEQAAAHALAQSRFNGTARTLGAVGTTGKLTSSQLVNLSYQLNDVVVSLASGQRPLMVLMQQGSQIAQIFGPGTGVTGILRGVWQGLTSLISPTTAVVGGIAAIGAAVGYSYYRYIESQKELEVALAGTGRAAGATVGQIERIAEQSAFAGNVSVAAAREMAAAFLGTGKIAVANFEGLIKIVKNYAATTGTDAKAATKELASAFADPIRGADALNDKLNFLDDRTRAYIRTLADHNDRTGSQRLLLDALKGSLVNAAEATTALGRAWDFVGRMASNAYDAIGRAISRAIDGAPIEERLKELLQERARLQALIENPPTRFAAQARNVNTRLLANVDAEIAKIEAKLNAIETRARDARANELSIRAGTVARELTPGFEELQALRARQAQLRSALDDPLVRQKVADLRQVEAAYDAITRALRTWLDPAEKARRLDELELKALEAKTPAQKAAIAEERRRLELAGQAIPVAIAEADIARAATQARAEATQALIDQSRVVEVNTRATLGLAEAWLKGAAAAQQAEVRRKALTEAVQNGVDVEARARELLREQIAEQAAQSAKSVSDLTAEADAQRRLNDAVLAGRHTSEQAQRQMQVEQALRPLIIAQSLAEGEAKTTLARIIDHLRGAYARLHGEQARAAALQTLEGQRNQVELLQKQIELAGTSESQRAIIIAQLQAEQQLRQKGIDLASAEGQAILANAATIERLNQELARSQGAMQALQGITDTTFNHFANLIAEGKLDWKSWADAGRAAIADIEKEILKLAVLNPFKNMLFGTNLPTLGNVGGLLGNLFGGFFGGGAGLSPATAAVRLFGSSIYHAGAIAGDPAPTRFVPRDLFRTAPRFHDGAFLKPDEVPAILQRGERVLSREETRRYAERESGAQPIINVVIQTPNPAAFQASRTQIAAELARAVRMGTRGL